MKGRRVVNALQRQERGGDGRWIYGVNAVRRRLERQPDSVLDLVVSRSNARVAELVALAPPNLGVRSVEDVTIRQLAGTGAHQGVAARTKPFTYASLDRVLAGVPELLVVLDQLEDPHNFGAVLRTAASVGVAAVIVPRHGAVAVTPAVEKVAAGAVNDVAICEVPNLARLLPQLHDAGFWSVGLTPRGGIDLFEIEAPAKTVVVLGGEQGLRPLVARHCDVLVSIPMASGVESLNASVAAAVVLYELRRQRTVARGGLDR